MPEKVPEIAPETAPEKVPETENWRTHLKKAGLECQRMHIVGEREATSIISHSTINNQP